MPASSSEYTCGACRGRHTTHTRREGCKLEGVQLGYRQGDCKACHGSHVRRTWIGPGCKLAHRSSQRRDGDRDDDIQARMTTARDDNDILLNFGNEVTANTVNVGDGRDNNDYLLLPNNLFADNENYADGIRVGIYSPAEVSAARGRLKEMFKEAARAEIAAMTKTGTLLPLQTLEGLAGYEILPSRLVWSVKRSGVASSTSIRGKLRWTVAGCFQRADARNLSTSNVDATVLRVSLPLASHRRYAIGIADVTTAFLLASLDNRDGVLIVRVPQVLTSMGLLDPSVRPFQIARAMYGLRSSPAAWARLRDAQLRTMSTPSGMYVAHHGTEESVWRCHDAAHQQIGWLITYVDDIMVLMAEEQVREMLGALGRTWALGSTSMTTPTSRTPVAFLSQELCYDEAGNVNITQSTVCMFVSCWQPIT
jgi:hypothetical protein